jgi:hypothetical protein
MSLLPCRFEPQILAAEPGDPAVATHLGDCPRCREALHLRSELAALARRSVPLRPLPPAEELRSRAELARRLALEPIAPAPRRRIVLTGSGAALLLAAGALAPAGALADLMAVAGAAAPATRILLMALLAATPVALAGAALGFFGEEA